MKKKYQSLIAILSLIFVVAVVISCRKNESLQSTDLTVSPSVLQALKAWHAANIIIPQKSVNSISNTATQKIMTPIWNKATYKVMANGEHLINVDAPQYTLTDNKIGFSRTFLFKESRGIILDGHILEFYTKTGDLKNMQDILASYDQKTITGFTGAIIVYDINYHYQYSRVYQMET